MAKIRNTMAPNMFGSGHEKEITFDNGEKYIIRNTMAPNMFGDGNEQEIVKKNDATSYNKGKMMGELIVGIGALIIMGILWIILHIM